MHTVWTRQIGEFMHSVSSEAKVRQDSAQDSPTAVPLSACFARCLRRYQAWYYPIYPCLDTISARQAVAMMMNDPPPSGGGAIGQYPGAIRHCSDALCAVAAGLEHAHVHDHQLLLAATRAALLFCFVLFCLFLGKQNALES